MKQVFLFAGQGSQKAGMGKDFYDTFESYRKVIDSAQLSFDLRQMMHEAPLEELSKTEYTQPCMAAFAAGVLAVLKENGIVPEAACGLSLGEYGALYAAGVLECGEYLKLVEFRGKVMAEAAKECSCSMSAILGLDAGTVENVCDSCKNVGYITLANYNCPGQYVICGDEEAVLEAEKKLKEQGARRCVRLNVSGPFHTSYMKPAGDALKQYFETLDFQKPQIPVVLNVTGDFYQETEDLKTLCVQQVQNSVRLEASLRKLLEAGAEQFVEIGPGNTLAGFLKKTAKDMGKKVQVTSIDSVTSLEKYLQQTM